MLRQPHPRRARRVLLVALLALGLLGLNAVPASAATFTVTTTDDSGAGSLRQAILDSNANSENDTIAFNLPGSPPYVIQPASPLPVVQQGLVIDGTTQPGFQASTSAPVVQIDGALAGAGAVGITTATNVVQIQGLSITNFLGGGISIQGTGPQATITGNYVGLAPDGTTAGGNGRGTPRVPGIKVCCSGLHDVVIGRTATTPGNVVAHNGVGIEISGQVSSPAAGVVVAGNYIGTDATGNQYSFSGGGQYANLSGGVIISQATFLTIADNVVSGGATGLELHSVQGQVRGNKIGLGADGTSGLFNGFHGVFVGGESTVTIGGTSSQEANTIIGSGFDGVRVADGAVKILRNSIHTNGSTPDGDGIDIRREASSYTLEGDGPNTNDIDDTDGGPNGGQNHPVISSATPSASDTTVSGTLDSTPSTTFRVEFFSNTGCDVTNFGEGRTFLGARDVTTDSSGDASFSFSGLAVATGSVLTATATHPTDGTSEFSGCFTMAAPPSSDGVDDLAIAAGPADVNARGGRHAVSDLDVGSLPLRDAGLEASPLRGIDVSAAPLRGIDMDATPLRGIPLRGIPLRGIPLRGIPLRGIADELPLSSLQLFLPGGWEAVIAGTGLEGIPLQSLTLGDILDDDPTALDNIDLADVGLAASPLRGISVGALSVGAAPLRGIELPGFEPAADYTSQWQALLADLGHGDAGFDGDSTLMQLDVMGVPLRGIPLRGIPLRGILLADTALMDSPLRGIPLRGIPLAELPNIDEFVDCNPFDCAAPGVTLGDAADAGAVLEEATLGELLLRIVAPEDYPWEDVPLDALAKLLPLGNTVGVDVTFTPGVAAGTDTATVTVDPPNRVDYVPGSAELNGSPIGDPTVNGDGDLVFSVPVVDAAPVDLSFLSSAGFRLGQSAFNVHAAVNAVSDTATSDPVTIGQRFEPNDTPAGAQSVSLDDLVVSHIASQGDVDYYRIPAPPAGTRLGVYLSHQAVDGDLVLYSPATAPLRGIGFRGLPLRGIPIQDGDETGLGPSQHAKPEALDDTTLAALPLRGISANRGEADESIEVASIGTGDYIVQVSGYNGANGDLPYVLRAQAIAEPPNVACGPRSLPNPVGAAGTRAVSGLPTDSETLVLVNQQRLTGTHGATASTQVMAALDRLVARPKGKTAQPLVRGGIVTVDSVAAVRTAYAGWDAEPCDVAKANATVTAIGDVIDAARARATGLKHIVLVGGDDLLPQARVADLTKTANQRDYAGDVEAGNPLHAAMAGSYVLSDNPYGDIDPIAWLDRALYVPDLAVGRLVESPTDIINAVDRFITSNGRLDPTSATVSGYDFLTDGADDVASALDAHQRTGTSVKLVGEDWNATQLRESVASTTAPKPDIASVNAHFDHFRALSAFGNQHNSDGTRVVSPDVMSVDDLGGLPTETAQRIWFSMGCHAGLNVADIYVGSKEQDWAQSLATKTAGFVGNTGYGYGDTERVALSEQLMAEFAERLDGSMSIGQALTFAKHEYFAQLGIYGEYDKKVLEEATFYGLPMYRIGAGTSAPTAPAPRQLTTDPKTQLSKATVSVDPQFEEATAADGSTYPTVGGDAQVTQNRPIQPRTATDVTQPGKTAKGALITELSSTEATVAAATFARPVIDHSADEPAQPTADVVFPAAFSTISTYRDPSGQRQRLVLLPGQFISDPEASPGEGTQRLFTHMETEVFYSDSADATPPRITSTQAITSGTNTRFEVDAADDGTVKRVLALYREPGSGNDWQSAELAPAGGLWRANVTTTSEEVEFFVQAVDGAGNVAISSNKGAMFPATASDTPEPPPLQVQINSPTDGAQYLLHDNVVADYECSGGTGTPTCLGDVPDGAPINTATLGPKTFTVTATDGVAPASKVHTYRVNYGFDWQLADGASLPGRGSQPIRWRTFDALGATYGLPAISSLTHQQVSCSSGAPIGTSQSVSVGGRRSPVTYDAVTGFTTFAAKTAKSWPGTCRIFRVTTTDGELHTLRIQFT